MDAGGRATHGAVAEDGGYSLPHPQLSPKGRARSAKGSGTFFFGDELLIITQTHDNRRRGAGPAREQGCRRRFAAEGRSYNRCHANT